MDENRKNSKADDLDSEDLVLKRLRNSELISDDEDEDQYEIEEEIVMKKIKLLEAEMSCSSNTNMNNNTPSSSSLMMNNTSSSSSSNFVTMINGNEESCGSLFSDPASTIMASFDMSCGTSHPMGLIFAIYLGLRV
ncbi:hypothetical protein BVC80_8793g16 [Macleaya cordata]|uniref:Uncharacterized protein n=1 Tax=Macleaya cordata TaxID=56857 RepID=A0A200PSY7_MACCD|nr:hypothetical protein BVC80_8793g16 [Macleaya cordata]